MHSEDHLEYRDIIPETILDFRGLRKSIVEFKSEQAIEVLMRYFEKSWSCEGQEQTYPRFRPGFYKSSETKVETGTHDIGVFSTALCLETIAAYSKGVPATRRNIDNKILPHEKEQNRRDHDRRVLKSSQYDGEENRKAASDRRQINDIYYECKNYIKFFRFIIIGLSDGFGHELGFLARIATLFRFGNYLTYFGVKEKFLDEVDSGVRNAFNEVCIKCICKFYDRFKSEKEGIHPFELYRFLQFVRQWGQEISDFFHSQDGLSYIPDGQAREGLDQIIVSLREEEEAKRKDVIFKYFFDEVYLFAKYELYRQMSLNQSRDSRLYDAKRLIYALLIVSIDNRFSNRLIQKKALDLIFLPFKQDKNAIWPTGQQVAMSKNGLMIISDNECVCDLLGCEHLNDSLLGYISELKCIYDGYARTKRMDDKHIIGWYPMHQRDQTPTSWCTALTLSFIKRFCKLVSLKLSKMAKERFKSNYRKPDVKWNDVYDCTAVKSKIRLMFPRCADDSSVGGDREFRVKNCKYRSVILFGPPGTGKTTYGRAVANRLELDYLELTPGDFFAGGESKILITINDIFEHLLHLKNTVVFIDEIDDLVKDRDPVYEKDKKIDQPYDPRTLFVNSLLPRFQELHDKKNIILLMATNNIERVDSAISRMGRVDLVIPVGAISPHGRLKYWNKVRKNNESVFSFPEEKLLDLDIAYLNATEAFNYGALKHFTGMMIEEVENMHPNNILNKIKEILENQTKKKRDDNPLLIWERNVIKEGWSYDTRPKYEKGDFQDFGHFDLSNKTGTKRRFQEDFVELFNNINNDKVDKAKAEAIETVIHKYSGRFQMEEEEYNCSGKAEKPYCKEIFYNIMTPFYDDLEYAINDGATCRDEEVKGILGKSVSYLNSMIRARTILPD